MIRRVSLFVLAVMTVLGIGEAHAGLNVGPTTVDPMQDGPQRVDCEPSVPTGVSGDQMMPRVPPRPPTVAGVRG